MPVINRAAALHDEITAWRRDLHENPELNYCVYRTASIVANKLKAFGCDTNILLALQSIVARNLDPVKSGVVTVGTFHGGDATNVIPQTAVLEGTVRSLEPEVRDLLEKRVCETAKGIAAAYGAKARVDYVRN